MAGPVVRGHAGGVRCLAWCRSGWLVSGSDDRTIRLWRFSEDNGSEVMAGPVLRGHTELINFLAWSRSGWFVSGSEDKTIRLWHFSEDDSGEVMAGPILRRPADSISSLGLSEVDWLTYRICSYALSEDDWLVSASSDRTIRLWHLPEGGRGEVREEMIREYSGPVGCLAFSKLGWLASVSDDKAICFWEIPSGRLLNRILLDTRITSLESSGSLLYAGTSKGDVLCYNVHNIHDPRICWFISGNRMLRLRGADISGVYHLSSNNQALCHQRGAMGSANPDVDAVYEPRYRSLAITHSASSASSSSSSSGALSSSPVLPSSRSGSSSSAISSLPSSASILGASLSTGIRNSSAKSRADSVGLSRKFSSIRRRRLPTPEVDSPLETVLATPKNSAVNVVDTSPSRCSCERCSCAIL